MAFLRLPSVTAFAIRICSLLTESRTVLQSMDFHFAFQLVGASADLLAAVICFPSCKDSPDSLATKHPQDVCSLSSRAKFEPVSTPLQDGLRFFLPLTPASPSVCLAPFTPRFHLPESQAEIRDFHVPRLCQLMSDLGLPSTPAVRHPRVGS